MRVRGRMSERKKGDKSVILIFSPQIYASVEAEP